MSYFDDYDERDELRSILPTLPRRKAVELSLLSEQDREAKLVVEMQRVIGLEDEDVRRHEAVLQRDLAYLRQVIAEGERGCNPWRVKAAVDAALQATPRGERK